MKKPSTLSDHATEAIAYYFAFWWAVVTLEPGKQRAVRSLMADMGLVEPKGPLALTRLGKQVLRFAQAPDRPKYPRQRTA